jgi:RHS repeat-associated protein
MGKGFQSAIAAALFVVVLSPAALAASAPGNRIPADVPAAAADMAMLPHRLVASHAPSSDDIARLQSMLADYRSLPQPGNFAAIERYLQEEPGSPWRLALRLNLGTLYYENGYYSRAIGAFDAAWHQEGMHPDARTLPLRDAAIGELARMHARLGHVEALQELFAEIGDRPLYGSASEAVAGAREGLWHMLHDPAVAYRCGPAALTSIVESARQGSGAATPAISKVSDASLQALRLYPSGSHGVSMEEVVELADRTGMGLVPARREGDAEIPLPAVVHWKVSHYAAIVGKRNGLYHVIDPTFGRDQWLARPALDSESSGMFLIPASHARDAGWQRVALADTKQYYGRGYLTGFDQDDTRDDAPTTCPGKGDGTGMCVAKVTTMLVSLRLDDKPVGYAPPVGPAVRTKVSYNQREASQPASMGFFNIGPKWTLNWLSYIEDRPGTPGSSVKRHAGGGGELDYGGYSATSKSFKRELRSGATLVMVSASPIVYERRLADGSKEVYAASNGATGYPRRVFLSRIVDPQGNAISLEYDTAMRLLDIRDALGQATHFSYEEASNPLLVSRITDPFGRTAQFAYDALGRLASITDAVGIVSQFTYEGDGTFISRLHTPYGDTGFAATTTGTSRSLEITDPAGNTSRVEFLANATGLVPSTDTPPGGFGLQTQYQQYRNTFFWDGEALARERGHYTMAQVSHWLHNGNIIPAVLESIKAPLETRVWYLHEGQVNSIHLDGSVHEAPTVTTRRLPDGSTQTGRNAYTAGGNVSAEVDPLNRDLRFDYDANGTDVVAMRRKVGSAYQAIAHFAYNGQHRPVSYTDEAGRTWSMQYNARGQLTGTTNPLGETTAWQYDADGYLERIVNPDGKTMAAFTHDAVGRIATATDAGGYTVRYAYDNLDRIVSTTYPDGTATTNTWTNLDLTAVVDRLGRVTRYAYDANRSLVQATDPAGHVTRYGYDRANRLAELTDADGNVTRWERDIQGRVVAKVFPDGTRTTYAYDTAGRLLRETDALGQVRQYTYARDDRLVGVGYGSAINPTPAVGFAWDAWFPRLVSMVDGTGTTQYAYHAIGTDGAGRLAREATPQGEIDYVYDALGRMSGRIVDGSEEAVEYDALGRVTGEGNALGNFQTRYLGETGQPAALELLGGKFDLALGYEANAGDRRLADLAYDHGKWSWEFAYDTDPAARVLSEQGFVRGHTARNPLNHEKRDFAYDDADRLLEVAGSNGSHRENYGPDPAGNLLAQAIRDPHAKDRNNAGNEWIWSAQANANNQLVATRESAWEYDAAGSLLNDGKRSYRWDAQHRLVQIANLQTGHLTDIAYDGLGRRVRMAQRDGESAPETVSRYLWCGAMPCEKLDGEGNTVARYFSQGELQGTTPLLYQRDRLGSVRGVVDPRSGEEQGSLSYTAYGQTDGSDGLLPDRRYAGMFFDEDSGLYLTWYRAYDPEAGRWLSRDPIGEAGGMNLYAYVDGNPANGIDPSGRNCVSANGFTVCRYPNGPAFRLPTPPDYPDLIERTDLLYHKYDVQRKIGCADADKVMQAMIDSPTPGNPSPASEQGTPNNAVVAGFDNFVTSYLTHDLNTGQPLVVNITGTGSLFGPGYVARAVTNGVAHTYGEGENWKQSPGLWGETTQEIANEMVWGQQMSKMISECGCSN